MLFAEVEWSFQGSEAKTSFVYALKREGTNRVFLSCYMPLGFCGFFCELCHTAVCIVGRRKVNVEDGG